MFKYELTCKLCKKTYEVCEGTREYKEYKKNMRGTHFCNSCNDKILLEARKMSSLLK